MEWLKSQFGAFFENLSVICSFIKVASHSRTPTVFGKQICNDE